MDEKDGRKFHASYALVDDCWMWIRGHDKNGYGAIIIGARQRRAHRVSYELAHSVSLTPDLFIHHICRNKGCVNPLHLEITTQTTHVDSAVFGNKEKTHCPHGHEYTEANICWRKDKKHRECMQCKRQRMKRREERKKQYVADKIKALALKCKQCPVLYVDATLYVDAIHNS